MLQNLFFYYQKSSQWYLTANINNQSGRPEGYCLMSEAEWKEKDVTSLSVVREKGVADGEFLLILTRTWCNLNCPLLILSCPTAPTQKAAKSFNEKNQHDYVS